MYNSPLQPAADRYSELGSNIPRHISCIVLDVVLPTAGIMDVLVFLAVILFSTPSPYSGHTRKIPSIVSTHVHRVSFGTRQLTRVPLSHPSNG